MKMNLPTRKQMNREKLEAIAEIRGDMILTEMFWDMFDDLSAAKQEQYIERARRIVEDENGIQHGRVTRY